MARSYGTLAEFTASLKLAYSGITPAIEASLKANVPSIVNRIKLRVSTTGVNADGGSFSTPYSKSHTYKRKKYGNGGLGTQTGYKGFYYKGTMWDSFKMISTNAGTDRVTASIGFVGSNVYVPNEKLNEIHSLKEGIPISAPNKEESRELVMLIGRAIGEYLNTAL